MIHSGDELEATKQKGSEGEGEEEEIPGTTEEAIDSCTCVCSCLRAPTLHFKYNF